MKSVKGKTVNGKMQFLRGTITENKKSSAKLSISVMLSFFFLYNSLLRDYLFMLVNILY